jgi:predicted RNA polymerase sigma factor
MNWDEIRKQYPDQWLVVEALEAHTTPDHQRHLDRLVVIERCSDGNSALASYRRLHQENPTHEYYYIHTARIELDIRELQWSGIRSKYAAAINR